MTESVPSVAADQLIRVPGVAHTALTEDLQQRLPVGVPGAPWTCRCQAVVWAGRGGQAAREALPAALHGAFTGLGTAGGLVRYRDTPVGPYDEVFAAVAGLGRPARATVPFMAVDSERSLVGGRANWSLPKTLATFDGGPPSPSWSATGSGWTVTVRAKPFGPTVPLRGSSVVVQAWPDGNVRQARGRSHGKGRAALITVEVAADRVLTNLMRPGRHLGMVVDDLTFTLAAPASV